MSKSLRKLWPWETRRFWALAMVLPPLFGCAVGPDYVRPEMPAPGAFKEAGEWKPGQPQDAAPRGDWWSVYEDPILDDLERQVEVSNQNLKAAEAAFRAAQAVIGEARAQYFPVVSATGSATRSGAGGQSGGTSSSSSSGRVRTQYNVSAAASWELDVWGRIRRTVEADVANAQASAADLASAKLSAQATLASDYLQLRVNDELRHLLEETVNAFATTLEITSNRYNAGTAAKSDVVAAQAQLDGTRAALINVGVQRAQLEHAIAALIGKPPAEFSIAPEPFAIRVPRTPPGLPSELLERRPDIAASERAVAAANAQIGIAESAYFPTLTLSGSYGFSNAAFSRLLTAPSALWSFGPQLAATLLDFGLRSSQVAAARATHEQTVANYRQTVLTAFQQVEDDLATLRILEQQQEVQAAAVASSEEAVRLFINQYKAGIVAYTSVITAQTTALTNEQNALSVLQSRLAASVALIQALGGGWNAAQIPSSDKLQ